MLFLLTGNVQIGKTRWLEKLISSIEREGFICYGVLAPGVWIRSEGPNSNEQGFEKLGIDNVLLPQGDRLRFADRCDIAESNGTFDANAQSARAALGWHISDSAIDRVNDHLGTIPDMLDDHIGEGVLVIDELGRLELRKGGGLTEAMKLLDEGPRPGMEDAILIVRDTLVDEAASRYADAWNGATRIQPNALGESLVMNRLESRH